MYAKRFKMYSYSYLSAVFYYKYLYANTILKPKQVICFKMYSYSYLSAVFYYKYLYANTILKPKQVICLEKLSFALACIYWQFFQPVKASR